MNWLVWSSKVAVVCGACVFQILDLPLSWAAQGACAWGKDGPAGSQTGRGDERILRRVMDSPPPPKVIEPFLEKHFNGGWGEGGHHEGLPLQVLFTSFGTASDPDTGLGEGKDPHFGAEKSL